MIKGLGAYVRRHHIGLVALFVALSGSAYAAATINSRDVVNNSLKSVDIKDGQVKEQDIFGPEPVRLVGPARGPGEPTCGEGDGGVFCGEAPNAWSNFGSGLAPAGFYKDEERRVHLQGVVTQTGASTGHNIFFLPPGYRPANGQIFPAVSAAVGNPGVPRLTRIDVTPGGAVQIIDSPAEDNAYLSLDGISYRAADP